MTIVFTVRRLSQKLQARPREEEGQITYAAAAAPAKPEEEELQE
jgi:hypothetical protein